MCDRFDFSYLSDEAKKGFMDSLWEINKTQVGAELLSSLDKSEKILLRQDEKQDCAGYYSPDFNILSISAFPLNAEVLFHELVHAREDSEFKIQSGDLEKMKSDIDVTNTLAELFARVRSCRFVTEYNSNSDKKIEPWIKKDAEFFQKVFNENVEKYPTNTEEENLKLAETAMAEQVFKEIKDFSAKGWKSFFELSANSGYLSLCLLYPILHNC